MGIGMDSDSGTRNSHSNNSHSNSSNSSNGRHNRSSNSSSNKSPGQSPSKCGIHVHYHPCGGSVRAVSTSYSLQIGLPQYAETNDMVIVYPQATSAKGVGGCFDWWGGTGADFDTKTSKQLGFMGRVVRALPEILAGI